MFCSNEMPWHWMDAGSLVGQAVSSSLRHEFTKVALGSVWKWAQSSGCCSNFCVAAKFSLEGSREQVAPPGLSLQQAQRVTGSPKQTSALQGEKLAARKVTVTIKIF